MRPYPVMIVVLLLMLIAGCVPTLPSSTSPGTLRVMTHDSFAISAELIADFEQENNVKMVFIKAGDTGAMLNRAILTKANPEADVLFGVDNTFLARALREDLFIPYDSPSLAAIPSTLILDPQHRVLPVDYGDVCINYDKAWFEEHALSVPTRFEDLVKPEYKNLLVMENPAASSPGLAFLLASAASVDESALSEFWQSMRANGLVVVNDWETAYYTNFSASSGRGEQPMVVSYGTSPAAEVVFADPPIDAAPTASITAPGMCFRQIESIGILRGTSQELLARRFVDAMLSIPFQEDIPLQMFVFPVHPQAVLPDVFLKNIQVAESPAILDPYEIDSKRDHWIDLWTEAVLK